MKYHLAPTVDIQDQAGLWMIGFIVLFVARKSCDINRDPIRPGAVPGARNGRRNGEGPGNNIHF